MTTTDDRIWVRVDPETKRRLFSKAERNGRTPSDVLRELITAWIDGRTIIQPHD